MTYAAGFALFILVTWAIGKMLGLFDKPTTPAQRAKHWQELAANEPDPVKAEQHRRTAARFAMRG